MLVPGAFRYRSTVAALNEAFITRMRVLSLVSGLLYGSTMSATLLSLLEPGSATIVYLSPRTGSIDTLPSVSAPVAVFTDQSATPMATLK